MRGPGLPRWRGGSRLLVIHNQCAQTRKSQPSGACQAPGLKILKENNPPALLKPKKNSGQVSEQILVVVFRLLGRLPRSGPWLGARCLPGDLRSSDVPVAALGHISTWEGSAPDKTSAACCKAEVLCHADEPGAAPWWLMLSVEFGTSAFHSHSCDVNPAGAHPLLQLPLEGNCWPCSLASPLPAVNTCKRQSTEQARAPGQGRRRSSVLCCQLPAPALAVSWGSSNACPQCSPGQL